MFDKNFKDKKLVSFGKKDMEIENPSQFEDVLCANCGAPFWTQSLMFKKIPADKSPDLKPHISKPIPIACCANCGHFDEQANEFLKTYLHESTLKANESKHRPTDGV